MDGHSEDLMLGQVVRAMIRQEVEAALVRQRSLALAEPEATARALPPGLDPHELVPIAEYVLREAGEPLHVKELARRMYALGFEHRWPPKHKDQLERSLNSLASPSQNNKQFVRVAPRTLGLR